MKNPLLEENKARWMLFEQVSSTKSALIWTVVALLIGGTALYLFWLT